MRIERIESKAESLLGHNASKEFRARSYLTLPFTFCYCVIEREGHWLDCRVNWFVYIFIAEIGTIEIVKWANMDQSFHLSEPKMNSEFKKKIRLFVKWTFKCAGIPRNKSNVETHCVSVKFGTDFWNEWYTEATSNFCFENLVTEHTVIIGNGIDDIGTSFSYLDFWLNKRYRHKFEI